MTASGWFRVGEYLYEYTQEGFTGVYRCVGGRLASGEWPQWSESE